MGTVHFAEKVCLIVAVCHRDTADAEVVLQSLKESYGRIRLASPSFPFVHTHYYEKEMGKDLKKFFIAFCRLIDPMDIVDIKFKTNNLEAELSENGKRRVNIDPGYLELPKLVLATTKNFSHRIYLGKGIYGDVQLFWCHGKFQFNPWTYPDYMEDQSVDFFTSLRNNVYLTEREKDF